VRCPPGMELVPPPLPWRGHGDEPSRSRSSGYSSSRRRRAATELRVAARQRERLDLRRPLPSFAGR
jgi:hypothetical protein